MKPYFIRVEELTATKLWINNVTQEEARLAIENGALGCTQNPSYSWKMLNHPANKAHALSVLDGILAREADDSLALSELQIALVEEIAEIFLPLYEKTQGRCGYVTIQEDPFKEQKDFIVERAYRNRKRYPNIMIKIPVTQDGMGAIGELVKNGVPINATEVMSVQQGMDVCRLYYENTENLKQRPVAVFSHIAGIFDEYLHNTVREQGIDISEDVLWQAGIAVAKKLYQITKKHWPEMGFVSGGARALHHFTEMVGADCMVTINWGGTADKLILSDQPVVERFFQPVPYEVLDELCAKLEDFRKAYSIGALKPADYEEFGPVVLFRSSFESAWRNALGFIAARRAELAAK